MFLKHEEGNFDAYEHFKILQKIGVWKITESLVRTAIE